MTLKLADIQDARKILQKVIIPTPILFDEKLSNLTGVKAYLKAECLQRSGSFKVRGAYNKIARLSPEEKARGVITASAGNHAQGVALAARLHQIKATIVLPEYAPLTKVTATKAQGAEVILHGSSFDEAVSYSLQLQEKHGYTYVHAFDDEMVIAGQGTIGWEIVEDIPETTVVVVPIGGGGIISGIALAVKNLLPKVRVYGVQAANCAAMRDSIKAGKPVEAKSYQFTIADGIAVKKPGGKTLEIIKNFVDDIVEVTEEEIASAIFHCVQNLKLVVEGAGAAGVAALLARKVKIDPGDTICTVLCGGNIDANLLSRVLEQELVRRGHYIILKLLVPDRPGMLAALTKAVAETRANIIEVFHRRSMWLAPLGFVGIEMLLEVRDEEHGKEVFEHLQTVGYHVEREGVGDWEE
ncbi:MAG: threonine ammonia-lyase [Pyrinomonadaceae bacterium]|nr:threonine ammonia-lyase [Pyrinomonadaceae bacterium]MCX7639209.1 threonine ammonia-lyase [Pyrinomonadaceae bacterium]MDW8303569.1 threonine ammonia-lyase [Acidobacteriota bacterium]